MSDLHEINVLGETKDYHRDRVTILIACSTPGCIYGKVAGSPSASIRRLVEMLRDKHAAEHAAPATEEEKP